LLVLLGKLIAKNINRFSYSKLSIVILIILVVLTIYFSGPLGLLIFITSAALGITTIQLGIKRMHLMGSLLVPTILFYLI
jgi:TctA family transporter